MFPSAFPAVTSLNKAQELRVFPVISGTASIMYRTIINSGTSDKKRKVNILIDWNTLSCVNPYKHI